MVHIYELQRKLMSGYWTNVKTWDKIKTWIIGKNCIPIMTFQVNAMQYKLATSKYTNVKPPQCPLSVAMFGASREHLGNILKEKIFWKVLDEKVAFVLKVYNLIITNADFMANSSDHEVMFQKYSKDIPGIL